VSTSHPSEQPAERLIDKREDRAIAMTVFSFLFPGGRFVQRLVYAAGRFRRSSDVDRLGMIHFARLALIREFPDHGQPRDDLRQPLQLFESSYNGSFNQYIDSFVDAIPGKMHAFWGTSWGFPWSLRPRRFKGYIRANQFPIEHYYVRHPHASVKMMSSALKIAQANAELRRDASALGPALFAERFRGLINDLQSDL
jgi:hypothetical protein